MYEEFFELMHTPFTRDIPADRLYGSRQIEDALGRLTYVADRQLFAVVTADPGCGKSTLIRMFESRLPKDKYMLLYLSDSKLTPRWLYAGLLDQMACAVGGLITIDFVEPMTPVVQKIDFDFKAQNHSLIIVQTGKGHADRHQLRHRKFQGPGRPALRRP